MPQLPQSLPPPPAGGGAEEPSSSSESLSLTVTVCWFKEIKTIKNVHVVIKAIITPTAIMLLIFFLLFSVDSEIVKHHLNFD